ncbi:hypothetical protein [Veronia pacifica]|nr:hypothetical protein [Veronia pacifica]
MLIAHLPACYIISRLLANNIETTTKQKRVIVVCGLFASILPDLDLLH